MTTADLGHDSFETDGGEFIVKHSTPKFPIFCRPSDDTIPENEAEERTTTETGETIESSAFMDLNREEREEFQGWEGLDGGLEREAVFQDLEEGERASTRQEEGERASTRQEEDPAMPGIFTQGTETVSGEIEVVRYPKRTATQRTYCQQEEDDEDEDKKTKDVYDFQADSDDDKDFVPSQPKMARVFSPSKLLVEISDPKKTGVTSKGTAVDRTPPEVVKARRDPEVEESLRGVGGHTPDEAVGNTYGSFNKELLSMLVHKLAKSKNIDLSKEPLKPGFFKDLVNAYGDVSNTNSCKLAPYKSHQYIMRKWREIYCTKVMSNTGTKKADVHLFEDQNSRTECRLCIDHPQTEDPRDQLLQKLSDQVNAAQEMQSVVKAPAPTGEKSKAKADKDLCPDCDRLVCNLKRHQSENCRANPKNLAECPSCKIMIVKRALAEHLNGRMDKKTGEVINQPCKGEDSKKVKCHTCGIMVKNLKRHTKERHPTKGPSAESSRISESGVKRPAESALAVTCSDAKRQKQDLTPLPALSQAQILELSEDLLFKIGQQRSREDVGGVDQEQVVRLGQLFMERAFGIPVSRASYLVDTDGNCLPNALSFIANPEQTEEETKSGGSGLRNLVMDEALDYIKNASIEALEPIQVAAAGSAANIGEWLSREQLLIRLGRYKEDGVWAGDLGDFMPQLYASFTKTPLFVILFDTDNKTMIGYFLRPNYVFNRPTVNPAPSPVMNFQRHFEPLNVPPGFKEAWEAIYDSHCTQELTMAAIQVQMTEEDIRGVRGERRDGGGTTSAAPRGRSAGDVDQRQQGEDLGGSLPGD